ncbi:MAG: putative metal-binding protein [Roseibaca calidilacus]|uniref:Putative metal-binding protein n=2 Tax=Roseibaca calidilacus TaxID=1666912 RepID=A0A0P7YXT2_9RHOB|nr:MAG: putative metal-binding protein [Roseibaca calidilacus]CUX81753.1 Uncharacterized ACR, COG1399 [Roseibaca calidilacus]
MKGVQTMTHDLPELPHLAPSVAVGTLNGRKPREILIEPDAATCAAIAQYLGLSAVRKMRFHGQLAPLGARDWEVSGSLGATVVQPCAVTLAPVTTRIDERIQRHFIADWSEPEGEEVEMTLDDRQEPLGGRIDLSAIVVEALALALPEFPRAEGAALNPEGVLRTAPEGETPLDDDAVKPFAGLAALRDKLDRS